MIRPGTPADYPAAAAIYRRASLSNAGDRDELLAHPDHLILPGDGLAERRTYVAEEAGSVVGFATWTQTGDGVELEDLFVDPNWMRRGIATTLVARIVDIGNATTEFGTAPRMALVIR
jgi:GNAT superfamily N-acetyltransferase